MNKSEKDRSNDLVPIEKSALIEYSSKLVRRGLSLIDSIDVKKIRLLIVDDRPETRSAIKKVLANESIFEVIGEAGTGLEGIEEYKKLRPDIVITDINHPNVDGLTMTEELCKTDPTVKVLILSVGDIKHYIRKAIASGAKGYLMKPPGAEELCSSIRSIAKLDNSSNIFVFSTWRGHRSIFELSGDFTPDGQIAEIIGLKQLPIGQLIHISFIRETIHEINRLDDIDPNSVKDISLNETYLTSKGLDYLSKMRNLENLSLANTNICDVDLKKLTEVKNLKSLDLSNTVVSDDGLIHLKDLEALNYIFIKGTSISMQGLAKINFTTSLMIPGRAERDYLSRYLKDRNL
jgi:CheY-like chemotaxis protein